MIRPEPPRRPEIPRHLVLAFVAGLAVCAGSTGLAETFLAQLMTVVALSEREGDVS